MRNPFQKSPIFHLASLARSGETLVLKYLSAHSKIHICHNLFKDDTQQELALFEHLMTRKSQSIAVIHPKVHHLKLKKRDVLLIKQGVWNHQHPFKGFVLARNPLSVFASLWTYDLKEMGGSPAQNWIYNIERMKRWLGKMDRSLLNGFDQLSPEQQFCAFYNQRTEHLASLGLKIFRYEDLFKDPEKWLTEVCSVMGLAYESQMVDAHLMFQSRDEGHGGTDLSRPLDNRSLGKYQNILSGDQIRFVTEKTRDTAQKMGYILN